MEQPFAEDGLFSEDELFQLQLLRDEEIDAVISADLLPEAERTNEALRDALTFAHPELTLTVTTGAHYPVLAPSYAVANHALPRCAIDPLRARLRQIAAADAARNTYAAWQDREKANAYGIFEHEPAVLHLAHETQEHIRSYRAAQTEKRTQERMKRMQPGNSGMRDDRERLLARTGGRSALSLTPEGLLVASLDLASASNPAYHILGETLDRILSGIPAHFRVLHVENVLRQDRCAHFDRAQQQLRQQLSALPLSSLHPHIPRDLRRRYTAAECVEHLVRPRVAFHGTQNRNVPNIVRYGFVQPGATNPATGETHAVRCGATYGQGIYTSPSALFALSYADAMAGPTRADEYFGLKLLVCAVAMGRAAQLTRADGWRDRTVAWDGADAHVANNMLEYIVFESARVLPCYVVHMDWGEDNAAHFARLPANPLEYARDAERGTPASSWLARRHEAAALAPGERRRRKHARLAKALKYFPYGYGPATGTSFVVEDVADVDDDEEEYGEYQKDRADVLAGESVESDFWKWTREAERASYEDGDRVRDQYLGDREACGFARRLVGE